VGLAWFENFQNKIQTLLKFESQNEGILDVQKYSNFEYRYI
jgi:hypothetical protein